MSDVEQPKAAEAAGAEKDDFMLDMFGDDSDDDIKGGGSGGRDEDFDDSDDGGSGKKGGSRLLKGGAKAKKATKKVSASGGADSEKDRRKQEKKARKAEKGSKKDKKRSRSDSADGGKTKRTKTLGAAAPDAQDNSKYATEGDEYDSEDVVADEDDDNFVADEDDDDLAGVMGEYNAEGQVFHDTRPDLPGGGVKKSKKGGGGTGKTRESTNVSAKATDVWSQTLSGMKKAKVKELDEAEKQRIATEFLKAMGAAAMKDDQLYADRQPAMTKLNMLKKVQDMVGVRTMQSTLLDYDVLGVLSDWVAPKPDNSLPSHTIRAAVYEMLKILPSQADHLKRKSDTTGRTIGMTVMALFRHKQETRENKLLLKSIIEKWSRPIFSKQSDARSADLSGNAELQIVVSDQIKIRAQNAVSNKATTESFEDAMKKRPGADAYSDTRASRPYSAGFLYTVKPESKVLNHTDRNSHDDGRKNMLKKMNDMKNANRSGVGKKEVKSTMEMQSTGRNKA